MYTFLVGTVLYKYFAISFSGGTDEFHQMASQMGKRYPTHKMVAVGFSMGGNIITKYLGEKRERPGSLIAGVSVCQGYDALR